PTDKKRRARVNTSMHPRPAWRSLMVMEESIPAGLSPDKSLPEAPALRNRSSPACPGAREPVGQRSVGRSQTKRQRPRRKTASHATPPAAEPPTPPPAPPPRRRPQTAVHRNLDRGGHGRVDRRLPPAAVAQALQQPLRHVLQRPEQLHRRSLPLLPGQLPQQAALLHQLQQQVGHLQQKVVGRPARVAVGVLQVQAAVLLRVKPLVLLTPTPTPAPRRHFRHRVAIDRQRRHPRPLRHLLLVRGLPAMKGVELPCPPLAVLVVQVVHPAVDLLGLLGRAHLHPLPRTEPQQPPEVPPQRRRPPLLE